MTREIENARVLDREADGIYQILIGIGENTKSDEERGMGGIIWSVSNSVVVTTCSGVSPNCEGPMQIST